MRAAMLHAAKDLRVVDMSERYLGPDEVKVRFAVGGIGPPDLSYYLQGQCGDFALREPLVLGHEVAGEVERVGACVVTPSPGDRVAINPSRPCLLCPHCRAGRGNLCRDMRFFGSAAIYPHVQGVFCESIVARADQCVKVPDSLSMRVAACAEPLAVALHGVRRAGELLGRNVLITGAGSIGILCLLAARKAGASFIAITDVVEARLALAGELGADVALNVSGDADPLAAYRAERGFFDVALEASGAPQALASLFTAVRPGGRVVQLGQMPSGEMIIPASILMEREIDFVGAFRFHQEFALAVDYLARKVIEVEPILSAGLPMSRVEEAFSIAADRSRAIKVHLHF